MDSSDLSRIVVVGTTGSGKTTVARRLAQLLGVAHVELDALNWQPGWVDLNVHDSPEFRRRVEAAVLASEAWVVDGNYRRARDVVWPRAMAVVWLDYPLWLIMWRLFRRTVRRAWTREELWNGNREKLRTHFLSRDSLFLWALQSHSRTRREYPVLLTQPEHAHLWVFRHRSPRETEHWLRRFEAGVRDAPTVRPGPVRSTAEGPVKERAGSEGRDEA